ncbi:MAG TPA: ATP-binding protein [Puia sp.]|nr:ATP-binding protein [Puia sp.]
MKNQWWGAGAGEWKTVPEKTLMDRASTLFWLADGGGRLIYFNNAFYRQFGVEESPADTKAQEFVPRDMAVFFAEKHRRVAQSGIPYRRVHHFTRTDGRCCSYLISIYTIDSPGEPLTGGEAWDVSRFSEEKTEQEEKFARKIVEVREEERTYLGHELHDNVIQIMISARLHLDGLKPKTDDERAMKSRATSLILSAIEESRRLSRQLAASQLKNSGLLTAIAQLLNDLRSTGRFNIKFNSSLDIDTEYHLSEEKKVALYRIVQEELSNIIRHSRARNIRVNIMQNNSGVILYTFDDGIGFDLKQAPKGMGLASIRNRAQVLNGIVDIATSPGKGCSVTVLMPYD